MDKAAALRDALVREVVGRRGKRAFRTMLKPHDIFSYAFARKDSQ